MSENKPDSPSLLVWVVSIGLFTVINIAAWYILAYRWNLHNKQSHDQLNEQTISIVIEEKKTNPNTNQVIVIGSSLVQKGIYCHDEFKKINSQIELYKISNNGSQLEHMISNLHILDSLIKYPPALILIEAENLIIDYKEFSPSLYPDWYTDYTNAIRNYKKMLFRHQNDICGNFQKKNLLDSSLTKMDFRRVKSLEENHYILPYLTRLEQSNIKVKILHLPRPVSIENEIRSSSLEIEFQAALQYYYQQFGIEYLQCNEDYYWNEFSDSGHLNQTGREKYSRWLSYKINSTLKQ